MIRPGRSSISARVSADRWLLGYADIVTLLLACFASLYAAQAAPASAGSEDPALRSDARSAGSGPPALLSNPAPAPAPTEAKAVPEDEAISSDVPEPMPDFDPDLDALRQAIAPMAASAELPGFDVTTTGRGVVLSFPEAGSFPTGQAELTAKALRVLESVAAVLRQLPHPVRVEGHTDDVPIMGRSGPFASNWELSTARATRVVQFLIGQGLTPDRLAAAGYAEHRPRVPNTSRNNRARNRRVDLVVLGAVAASLEPPGEVRR
jgi:chemotaxis protein MotB